MPPTKTDPKSKSAEPRKFDKPAAKAPSGRDFPRPKVKARGEPRSTPKPFVRPAPPNPGNASPVKANAGSAPAISVAANPARIPRRVPPPPKPPPAPPAKESPVSVVAARPTLPMIRVTVQPIPVSPDEPPNATRQQKPPVHRWPPPPRTPSAPPSPPVVNDAMRAAAAAAGAAKIK